MKKPFVSLDKVKEIGKKIVDDIKAGKEETVDDLLSTLQKLMK